MLGVASEYARSIVVESTSMVQTASCAASLKSDILEEANHRLATFTSISTSLLPASLVTLILLDQAFMFLNSKSTQVFCLNNPTHPTQTLLAVFASHVSVDAISTLTLVPGTSVTVRVMLSQAIKLSCGSVQTATHSCAISSEDQSEHQRLEKY